MGEFKSYQQISPRNSKPLHLTSAKDLKSKNKSSPILSTPANSQNWRTALQKNRSKFRKKSRRRLQKPVLRCNNRWRKQRNTSKESEVRGKTNSSSGLQRRKRR